MNSNRVYHTPRVEIGSEQYWDDVALMQSFYDYEDYLNYMKDGLDADDFHDKDRSRASRRKITARHHRRSVRNSKIPNHKERITWKSDKACYKRARILQPQCVELEDIMPNAPLEVIGLRISEHPTGNCHRSITAKANTYEKRVSCLLGEKKKEAQKKQAELKVKKAEESTKIAEDKEAKKVAWAAGFTTFKGKVLDCSNEQSDSNEESVINVHGSYCNLRHRSSSHPVIVPRFATKETKVLIKMVRSNFIPIFF